jgi:acetyl/propionyl-CoA carboxylase alpha subunit
VSVRRAYLVGDERVVVDLRVEGGALSGTVGTEGVRGAAATTGPDSVVVRAGDRTIRALVVRDGADVLVSIEGRAFRLRPDDGASSEAGGAVRAEPYATSPMTGVVSKVAVGAGDDVETGAVLFVVDAMKMEYVVRAERAARVAEVRRAPGDRVTLGEVVVAFGPAEEP